MKRGFTLFEIVFAIAIFAVLIVLALPVGLDSYRHYLLSSEVGNFLNILRRAQALSFANLNSAAHGVAVQGSNYIIFQGQSYAARNPSLDEVYARSLDITVNGPPEIDFTAVSGNPNTSSTFVLANDVGSRSISINDEGTINW
jgi:prepilin-type N-terminal cleavage/methylation domain-containing protein